MIQKETEENNKLIAEFMGWYHKDKRCFDPKGRLEVPEELWEVFVDDTITYDCPHYEGWKELKFHSLWEWIMKVVNKINSFQDENNDEFLYLFIIRPDYCVIQNPKEEEIIYNENGVTEKELVYITVIKFIEWYNQQQNN